MEETVPMEGSTLKTTAFFAGPFSVPGLDETLPAGRYEIETEICPPPDHWHPKAWKASVSVKLHPRASHPGLARSLTLSLADFDIAQAKDKLSGKYLSDFFLEEMLADPVVGLVMEADGVSETRLRHLYSAPDTTQTDIDVVNPTPSNTSLRNNFAIQIAENEGMPTLAN
jgi:hypothetical protein